MDLSPRQPENIPDAEKPMVLVSEVALKNVEDQCRGSCIWAVRKSVFSGESRIPPEKYFAEAWTFALTKNWKGGTRPSQPF
jgi:hypothetical protein